MNPSFRDILDVYQSHGVEYIIVGGVAAVIQGAPVTTFDLDTLIRVNEENAERVLRALTDLDARYREHDAVLRPSKTDIVAGGHMLLLTRAGPLDVLGFVGNQERYEDLIGATIAIRLGAEEVPVLNLSELIRLKKITNRPKDRAVLDLLEEVLQRSDGDNRKGP